MVLNPEFGKKEINVSDFIRNNYTEYTGDESFLTPATEATNQLWAELSEMFKAERKKEFMMLKLRNHLRLMLMELVISIKI